MKKCLKILIGIIILILLLIFAITRFKDTNTPVKVEDEQSTDDGAQTEDPFEAVKGFSWENRKMHDGLTLLAVLEEEVLAENKQLVFENIFSLSDQQAVISFSAYDMPDAAESDHEADRSKKDYLLSYDFLTATWSEALDITAAEGEFNYLEQNGLLWIWNVGEQSSRVTGYDGKLSVVKEFNVPADCAGMISPDGEDFYYISDRKLFHARIGQGLEGIEEVVFDTAFSPNFLFGVFQNEQGENYGLTAGIAGDLKYYSATANLETGAVLNMNTGDQGIIYIENGIMIDDKSWTSEDTEGKYTLYAEGGLFEYNFSGEQARYMKSLGENRVLFIETEAAEDGEGQKDFGLWLYDASTGRKMGSAYLSTGLDYAYISQAVPYPGENALLLCVTTESGEGLNSKTEIYRWDYEEGLRQSNDPVISEADASKGLLGSIDSEWDLTYFTPGECPSELADLREQADQLEEKYGIQIKLSDECRSICGDYAVMAVSDRESISEALVLLDYELSKYPEHFFQQFVWDGIDGIDIYLAGMLIGMTSDVLDVGGALTTVGENRLLLIYDCTEPYNLTTTIHHEIAHAIDRKLQSDYTHNYLDDEEWNKFNPSSEIYSYNYSDYVERDYEQEGLYDYIYSIGTNKEKVCFMDIYALTFPTEDRARIFEYAMADGYDSIWQEYPRLQEKLDFFAQCIRSGFDTSGWEKVRWDISDN